MNTRHLSGILSLLMSAAAAAFGAMGNDSHLNDYDVKHYDLALQFNFLQRTFKGSVVVEADMVRPTQVFVLSAANGTITIDSVLIEGKKTPFIHKDDQLSVILPANRTGHHQIRCTVFYNGHARFEGQYDTGGISITIVGGLGRVSTSSEPFFARNWWPCKDVPDDKATATIKITVPGNLTAISNGVLKSTVRDNENAVFTWETVYPIATYLVSVTVGSYRQFTDAYTSLDGSKRMKILYYVFPEDYNKARKDFQHTAEIIKYFASTFCEYPFIKEKFGYVEVNGNMTMENQTICSIDDRLITGDGHYRSTLVHEIAHHWWGDLLTPANWTQTWLNEGFASYAEALYAEHSEGVEGYRSIINNFMNVKPGQYAGSVIGRTDTLYWDSFSPRVYNKGAVVLHMLRGVMGDSAFFAAMRNYVNNPKFRFANVTTADFENECEKTYGKTLKWFFDEWIYAYTEGIDRPEYSYAWSTEPAGNAYQVTLTLEQTTAGKLLYTMPMSVTVSSNTMSKSFMIVDSSAVQSFTFQVPDKPFWFDIDSHNWIFKSMNRKNRF